jgi:hypothetical protein
MWFLLDRKIPLERPRVRTREGQEVELESYGQLQQDGKLQLAVRERMVAGLSTRNYRRAVESVVEGYGIAKSSVSRQFVEASSNQLRVLCERRLEDLNLVVLMIDGIHFGRKQSAGRFCFRLLLAFQVSLNGTAKQLSHRRASLAR